MYNKLLGGLAIWLGAFTAHAAVPVHIVAAENFYGRISAQIGGNYVEVISILNNPQQDPHLFSSNPVTARAVANADIIIYNGLGYDPWINNLIASAQSKNNHIIVAASLTGKKMGDNPHIWYDPKTMLAVAREFSRATGAARPRRSNHTFPGTTRRFYKQLSGAGEKNSATAKTVQGYFCHRYRTGF